MSSSRWNPAARASVRHRSNSRRPRPWRAEPGSTKKARIRAVLPFIASEQRATSAPTASGDDAFRLLHGVVGTVVDQLRVHAEHETQRTRDLIGRIPVCAQLPNGSLDQSLKCGDVFAPRLAKDEWTVGRVHAERSRRTSRDATARASAAP